MSFLGGAVTLPSSERSPASTGQIVPEASGVRDGRRDTAAVGRIADWPRRSSFARAPIGTCRERDGLSGVDGHALLPLGAVRPGRIRSVWTCDASGSSDMTPCGLMRSCPFRCSSQRCSASRNARQVSLNATFALWIRFPALSRSSDVWGERLEPDDLTFGGQPLCVHRAKLTSRRGLRSNT